MFYYRGRCLRASWSLLGPELRGQSRLFPELLPINLRQHSYGQGQSYRESCWERQVTQV